MKKNNKPFSIYTHNYCRTIRSIRLDLYTFY